jgi:hypothetical protein
MYISILDKVRAKIKKEPLSKSVAGAIKWYRDQIRILSGYTGDSHYSRGSNIKNDLLADRGRARTNYFPGQMYLFAYKAKHWKTLPYWDKFPLVFFIGPCSDGTWLGINFHYLNYQQRYFLFHELLTLADKHPTDPRAMLKLSYRALKSMARFKAFKPCLHKYIPANMASHLVRVEAPDWETALFLPVESFMKRPKTAVWKDSDGIINGTQKGPSTDGLPKGTKKTSTTTNPVSTNGSPKKT